MTRRPFLLLAGLVAIAATVLVATQFRGFGVESDVPDTSPMVGDVTSDPDPRSSIPDDAEPLTADAVGADGLESPSRASDLPRPAPTISGVVVDGTGRAIEGASIELAPLPPAAMRGSVLRPGPTEATTQTDRSGAFELPARPTGWYRVLATKPGFAPLARRVPGQGARLELMLAEGAALAVRALTPAGKPATDTLISWRQGAATGEAATDANGRARFDAIPPGVIELTAEGPLGSGRDVPFPIQAGESQERELQLVPWVALDVQVVRATDGSPLAGAMVRAARPGYSTPPVQSDVNGRAEIEQAGAEGRRIFLSVDHPDFAPALVPVVLAAPNEGNQQALVRMVAGRAWSGLVEGPRGEPAAGVRVAFGENGVADRPPAETVSDENGRFTLPPPPPPAPGRRVILTASDGSRRAAIALRPGQAAPQPLILRLRDLPSVTGRITRAADDERPLAGVTVILVPRWREVGDRRQPDAATSLLLLANEQAFADLATHTDTSGRFGLAGVAPGPYEVQIIDNGIRRWPGVHVDVGSSAVDVPVLSLAAGGTAEGDVRDAQGRLRPGLQIVVALDVQPPRVVQATTDARGAFRFEGLPAGTHQLRLDAAGFEPFRATIEIDPDSTETAYVPIALESGGRLVLDVTTDGAPYSGSLQVLRRRAADGRAVGAAASVRVENGRARLAGWPSGAWLLDAEAGDGRRPDEASRVEVIPGRETRVRINLTPGLTLSGRVQLANNDPVGGAVVRIRRPDLPAPRLATTGADGRFLLPGLRAGTWLVEASGPGGAPLSESITLSADEAPTPLLLTLPQGGRVQVVVQRGTRKIGGAVVLFRDDRRAYPNDPPDRTDARGVLERADLPGGLLQVQARATEGVGRTSVNVVPGTTTKVVVQLSDPDPQR